MDEEKTQTETNEEKGTVENTQEGDKPQAANLIDGANAAAERLEKANAEAKLQNDRAEELQARNKLSGTAEGAKQVVDKKEETPKEYNDRIDKEMSEGKHE